MITFTRYNLIAAFLTVLVWMVPGTVMAADLTVSFEATPLFSNANVLPGDSESRSFTVTNSGTETENVYVSVENISVPGSGSNLADVMQLVVANGTTTFFTGSFTDFFGVAPVALGTLGAGGTETYTMTASLADSVGNPYQATTFGFDLVVGFEGGPAVTDTGGGGGGGGTSFTLFNEALVGTTTSAGTISWNTNRSGTTYLVCGDVADGPFILDPNDSQFGYPLVVAEVDGDTRDHNATITGLSPGTYECIPASRPSTGFNFTTGDPVTFTLPPPGQIAGITTTEPTAPGVTPFLTTPPEAVPPGEVAGVATETPTTTDEHADGLVAGALTDAVEEVLRGDCTLTWLVLLLVFSLGWSLIDDLWRKTTGLWRQRLNQNLIFGSGYALTVMGAFFLGLLEMWWWVFVLAWVLFYAFDYKKHQDDINWSPTHRHVFYVALAGALILIHFLVGWPCVWLPFAAVAIAAIALYISRL